MRVNLRQVVLLNCAQGFGRGSIAGKDYEVASALEECLHGLEGKLIYHIERALPIGSACVVAEIKVVILRKPMAYFTQYGQATVAGVEYSDGAGSEGRHII